MCLNNMYPNLQTEKNWSNFAKDVDQKPFCLNFNDLYRFKYRKKAHKKETKSKKERIIYFHIFNFIQIQNKTTATTKKNTFFKHGTRLLFFFR